LSFPSTTTGLSPQWGDQNIVSGILDGAAACDGVNQIHVDGTAKLVFRILVADDEKVTRMKLRHLLEEAGFKVCTARNGREAFEMARSQEFDLLLTDVNMPVIDGLTVVRFVRQIYDSAELPVIVMTASDDREQALAAFSAGANDYIRKPIDNEILLARLQNQVLIKKTQKALKESEERYSLAAQGTNDGIWDWNLITNELYLSPRWRQMVGVDPSATLVGNEWLDLVHFEDRERIVSVLEAHLCGDTDHFETEVRMRDNRHGYRWMLCRGLAVRCDKSIPCRIAGSLTDITTGKVADALTGLPNRLLFQDRVERAVEQLRRKPDRYFAVIYMDVDDFKLINDHMGHRVGDEFLVAVAKRIEKAIRAADSFVARLGGDEFAVVVEGIESAEDAITVAKRIHARMNVPFRVGDREILTRASMGIAVASKGTTGVDDLPLTAELLVSQADAAMYCAKKQTDSPYCVFEPQMLDDSAMALEMGHELKMAIERDELSVHYQPIVDIEKSSTVGFEALMRWDHPVHGSVPPSRFIPIAESNGLIVEIGEWILRQSCMQVAGWIRELHVDVMVSVNVSIRQIAKGEFFPIVEKVLAETGLPAHLLRLEVTETVLIQNTEETMKLLLALRELGIKIGIDDFGTGYSSLAYLHKMPVDVLKVDRSFVASMTESEKHQAIVQTIITLAESLKLQVVAEGIETAEQLTMLRHMSCAMGQGFFFAQPCLAEQAEGIISKNWLDQSSDSTKKVAD
jgi:diguanylate cyclase (GGDEF)-like protein/PAS domain S-box-containing protein